MKTAKAESVKCSASMTPTRNGSRVARRLEVAFRPPLDCGIEQPLNIIGPLVDLYSAKP